MKKKIMFTRIAALFVSVFLVSGLNAQENYLPGYILNKDNKKIEGFIDYRNWGKNPREISFKQNENAEKTIYKVFEIKAFEVKDERYVSAIVDIETSSRSSNSLTEEKEFEIEKDTVFLQTMFEGSKCLYHLKNKKGIENFYIKEGEKYTLLLYKKYKKEIFENETFEKKILAENSKFLGQLKVYLNSCKDISSRIDNAKYNKNNLEKLFQKYYDCTQSEITFSKKTERAVFKAGIVAGVAHTSLKFEGSELENLLNTDFPSSTGFVAGLSLDIILPRTLKRLSIANELVFNSFKTDGEIEIDRYSETQYTKVTSELEYSYLKLTNLLRYSFLFDKMSIYANAGIANGFVISEVNKMVLEHHNNNYERTEEINAVKETRKIEQGLVFGVGSQFNKFSLEARFEKGNGMSNISSLKSKTSRYYFILGYRF